MANTDHQQISTTLKQARARFSIPETIDQNRYQNIVEVVETAVKHYPHQPAFSCLGHTLTFSEVDKLATHFAAYLKGPCQLSPGDRIAIQLPNVLQYPVVVFGALKAGLVIVNTNPLYTPREMEHQFNDSEAVAIVVLANMASKVQSILPSTSLRHVIVTEMADLHPRPKRWLLNAAVKYLKKMVPAYHLPQAKSFCHALQQGEYWLRGQKTFHSHAASPGDIAALQYTGGTTGVAKGAMLSHANLIANMLQVYPVVKLANIREGKDIFVAPLPLYHIYAFMLHGMTAFSWGCHSILIPNPRDIPAFVKELERWPFNIMVGLNTLFIALLNNRRFLRLNFKHLKTTLSGGMALSESVAKEWQQVTSCSILEGYGLTETSPVVTLNPPGHAQIGTIGVPLPATDLKVVNEQGEECKIGVAGELCVQGPQVMRGYWERPEATREVLCDGWFATGDIAVIQEDGYIKIVDRKKDMILVSGFNVYPNEVENIVNSHPDVLESAAIGIPDPHSGEVVKLFIVRKRETLTEADIRSWCGESLTPYKCPKLIEFCDSLPKSNVGKVLRRELRPVTETPPPEKAL